jgi:GNAT superfamily N-acetyltransferase
VKVHKAKSDCDFDAVSALFHEYGASLDVDLSFQGFEEEIAMLPGKYAWPKGALFLASDTGGHAIGCVGVRPFDRPAACEMKRLYVRPAGRGNSAGRALAVEAIRFASVAGYGEMLLDTLPSMGQRSGFTSRSVSNRYRRTGITPFQASFTSVGC